MCGRFVLITYLSVIQEASLRIDNAILTTAVKRVFFLPQNCHLSISNHRTNIAVLLPDLHIKAYLHETFDLK